MSEIRFSSDLVVICGAESINELCETIKTAKLQKFSRFIFAVLVSANYESVKSLIQSECSGLKWYLERFIKPDENKWSAADTAFKYVSSDYYCLVDAGYKFTDTFSDDIERFLRTVDNRPMFAGEGIQVINSKSHTIFGGHTAASQEAIYIYPILDKINDFAIERDEDDLSRYIVDLERVPRHE